MPWPKDLPAPEALFDEAACGLLLTDPDGSIRRVNATFCRWLGRDAAELTGRRVQDLLSIGARVFHQTHWAPLMQIQGSVAEVKLDAVHRDGRKIPMLFNAIRRHWPEGRFDEIAVFVVTDREKYERELLLARKAAEAAQEQLSLADRRKDEFLATLAHELRSPLAPMRHALDFMALNPAPALRDASRQLIERQLNQMVRLVDDLLDVSRISQGKVQLRRERVDIADVLRLALETCQPTIDAAGHALQVDAPAAGLVMVEADVTRLCQIIANLLNNAAKYTPAGGRILLQARPVKDFVAIVVQDSGVGIPPDQLPHVFDMFTQIDRTLDRAQGGLGIGLALVKTLVELHGGCVSVASEGAGRGCSFEVLIPLAAPASGTANPPAGAAVHAPTSPTSPPPAHDSGAGTRVLIVDDNEDSAESLSQLLRLLDYQTEVAHDGLQALAMAEVFRPHIGLFDIGLPRLGGHDAARRLRQQDWGRQPLLIAVSGRGQPEDVRQSLEAGFDHHVVKPLDIDVLLDLLAAHIER